MKKTLIIVAHNNFENSLSNKIISQDLQKQENVEVRNLIELYPDYKIDIQAEQDALVQADTIVLQFPFFWYSCPAILKAWIDDVMQYGFAFGSG
ncbi:MAG: NAD(P)H-dependent oxidoreductase [Patescibacteria group bacterium]